MSSFMQSFENAFRFSASAMLDYVDILCGFLREQLNHDDGRFQALFLAEDQHNKFYVLICHPMGRLLGTVIGDNRNANPV